MYLKFAKLTLDTILTAVGICGLFALIFVGHGCAKRVHTKTPGFTVVEVTAEYQIGRESDTKFIIHAKGLKEAEDIAMDRLGCRKHTCYINPDGIILAVERQDYPKR